MAAPSHLRVDRKRGRPACSCGWRTGSSTVGAGPAELFAQRTGPREMAADQVITDAAGGRHRFATGAEVYYTSVPTRGGDYWKFDQAARFELWAQFPDGRRAGLVRVGPKLRYCLRDLDRIGDARPRVAACRPGGCIAACNQSRDEAAGHARHVGRLGRRLSGLLSRQHHRHHRAARLLRRPPPRRSGPPHHREQRGEQRLGAGRPAAVQARARRAARPTCPDRRRGRSARLRPQQRAPDLPARRLRQLRRRSRRSAGTCRAPSAP